MKPLKLKMTAFGPYKDTETIDFAELAGNQLFVISGSTGSGKTTIFDAICYALYGAASGSDRNDPRILRSDFADEAAHTAVELTFEVKEVVYKVYRQMGHIKGNNKTATGDRCEIFAIDRGQEKPCVDRQIVSEVNRKVEDVLGLTRSQFCQIVMLPQGEFRKLLTSETDNKEEILRKIFKTEPYKMAVDRLKRKRDVVKGVHDQQAHALHGQMKSIAERLPERIPGAWAIFETDMPNVHQTLKLLEVETEHYKEQVELAEESYDKAFKRHDEQLKVYHDARTWNERLAELADKEQLLSEWKQQEAVYEGKEQELAQAERASMIVHVERLYEALRSEQEEKWLALQQAIAGKADAAEQLKRTEEQYVLEQEKEAEREEAARRLSALEQIVPLVEGVTAGKRELQVLQREVESAHQAKERAEHFHKEKKNEANALAEAIRKLEVETESFDALREELADFERNLQLLRGYVMNERRWLEQEETLVTQRKSVEQVDQRVKEQEHAWMSNQAQLLARQLVDGSACPVCGSLDHPGAAVHVATEDVSVEQLDAAKEQLRQLINALQQAEGRQSSLKEQLTEQAEGLTAVGLEPSRALETGKELAAKKAERTTRFEQLQHMQTELKQKRSQLDPISQEVEAARVGQLSKLNFWNERKSAADSAEAVLNEKLARIPEELRGAGMLEQAIKQAAAMKETLQRNWLAAQQTFQTAKDRAASMEAAERYAKQTAEEVAKKCQEAERSFRTALEKSEFPDSRSYEGAKKTDGEIAELKQAITNFRRQLSVLEQQTQELKTGLQDKSPVDLVEMEQQLTVLKEAYERMLDRWNELKGFLQTAGELSASIAAGAEQTIQTEQELSTIDDLYDMVRGQNVSKLSFERFLQIEYLEQIIQAANERLRHLSGGQFYLLRSDRQEARGKQSGLGLDVYDAYTGQTRDVKTLSGGEKFNASLCLALGMADVIQSFQGNISIETMFIDEGFGSLDEESLNKSIETLIDLQRAGRMIGVISHVQELKAVIPAVLEVKKTKDGFSQSRFHIQ